MSNTRPDKEMTFSSGDWTVLKRWLNEQLDSHIQRLCNLEVTHQEADVLRGRILETRRILEFEKIAARDRLAAN